MSWPVPTLSLFGAVYATQTHLCISFIRRICVARQKKWKSTSSLSAFWRTSNVFYATSETLEYCSSSSSSSMSCASGQWGQCPLRFGNSLTRIIVVRYSLSLVQYGPRHGLSMPADIHLRSSFVTNVNVLRQLCTLSQSVDAILKNIGFAICSMLLSEEKYCSMLVALHENSYLIKWHLRSSDKNLLTLIAKWLLVMYTSCSLTSI